MPCLKPEGMHKARIMKKKIAKMELFIINQDILWDLCTLLLHLLTIAFCYNYWSIAMSKVEDQNKSGYRLKEDKVGLAGQKQLKPVKF